MPRDRAGVGARRRQVPAAVEELPDDLEGDERLARARGERQQDAAAALGNGVHHTPHGDVLVVAGGVRAAPVFEGHFGKAVAPVIRGWKASRPEFVGRRVARHFALKGTRLTGLTGLTRSHVDFVDALPVGGVGEADREASGVFLGLPDAFGQRTVPRLRLDDGQPGVAVLQHVVCDQGFAPASASFDAPGRNRELPSDAASLDDAPSRRLQRGIDVFGPGFGFVHVLWLLGWDRIDLIDGIDLIGAGRGSVNRVNAVNPVMFFAGFMQVSSPCTRDSPSNPRSRPLPICDAACPCRKADIPARPRPVAARGPPRACRSDAR